MVAEQKDNEPSSTTGPAHEVTVELEESADGISESDVQQQAGEDGQLLEALQRVQADFVNYKRRADEDRQDQQRYSNSRLLLKLLPVLDEFVLAIDHASKTGSEPSWLEGIALIQRKLNLLLESENVIKIQAQGKAFDPFEHEAMAYQENAEHPEGHVISVVREGYKMSERVLRPALVILAKEPQQNSNDSNCPSAKEIENA